jgi:thiamine pyrophosphokinase
VEEFGNHIFGTLSHTHTHKAHRQMDQIIKMSVIQGNKKLLYKHCLNIGRNFFWQKRYHTHRSSKQYPMVQFCTSVQNGSINHNNSNNIMNREGSNSDQKTPMQFHENKFYTGQEPFHLIVLNTPYCSYPLFPHLYRLANIVVCADGGANQLFDTFHKHNSQLDLAKLRMPDYICGDLDSLRSDVSQFYQKNHVKIIQVKDQDFNDLQKSLDFLDSIKNGDSPSTILIYGAGGRLDQEMCNLNAIYTVPENHRHLMISPFSCSVFLQPGVHKIRRNAQFEKKKCALIPLGTPCRNLVTEGLKWNINHKNRDTPAMQFGALVSTSNEFDHQNEVIVETSDKILWTWTLKR